MSRKKIKLGAIDIDPDQFAICLSLATEIQHFDSSGALVGQETVPARKLVRVPRGLRDEDLPNLAQEVVDKCKYIPASKVKDVEQCLRNLAQVEAGELHIQAQRNIHQQHLVQQSSHQQNHHMQPPPPPSNPPHGGPNGPHRQDVMDRPQQIPKRQGQLLPDADLGNVDDYQEQLYEDQMERKVQGAKRILRLCTEPHSLEIIGEHDTLLGVLSRELKESSKRSFDLSVAIVGSFLCFSHFSQFHVALQQHQCGNVIMRVFEYESERYQIRKQDMDRRTMRFHELGDAATAEDRRLLMKDEKKHKIQLNRQNKLMLVALMSLHNLAEEVSIEKKMVNRKMPQLLTQVLDRNHEELVLVALQFIKKLSVFEENKEQMSTPDVLSRLVQLASHENVRVALLALRVLYNFSFDEIIRSSLIESGIVKLLVDHLRNPPFRHIVLRLLYHFSLDERCKSLMPYHRDGMIMLLQLVVHFPEPRVGKDLVALVVNLATHPRAAEVMVDSGLFPQVMLRVLQRRDPWLCKVIRHCSAHPGVMERMMELLASESVRMSKWMHEFVRLTSSCVDNPDLLVEVLGTLVNINLPEVPWSELCEAGLVDVLTRLLVPGFSEDDIVLECVMLVSNIALARDSAQYVAGSRLPSLLQQILVEKREDEEIVVQLLFAFRCLLLYDEVRDVILQETELAPCVMRFACSSSTTVTEQATQTLQLVSEHVGEGGREWVEQIKAFRFEQYNSDWCRYIMKEQSGGLASPGLHGALGYEDEQHWVGEDEFAFRWAGGACGDVADLADRDWGNRDAEAFMHTARHMAIS